jgi:hypothetical protein
MRVSLLRVLAVAGAIAATFAPSQATAARCSLSGTSGSWAYTYSGTIFTSAGPVPAGSVGRFSQDAGGNVTGSQTRSVAGVSGVEDISGTVSVNRDCSATGTIDVSVNGQVTRTALLALVYDNNQNQARGIFQSLTLPNGTNVPVVITIDFAKVFPKTD